MQSRGTKGYASDRGKGFQKRWRYLEWIVV